MYKVAALAWLDVISVISCYTPNILLTARDLDGNVDEGLFFSRALINDLCELHQQQPTYAPRSIELGAGWAALI